MKFLNYTNLELEINFVNDKSDEILKDLSEVLKKHGFEQHSTEGGWDDSGAYQIDKVTFFPKECLK